MSEDENKPKKHENDNARIAESIEELASSVRTIKNMLVSSFILAVAIMILSFAISVGRH